MAPRRFPIRRPVNFNPEIEIEVPTPVMHLGEVDGQISKDLARRTFRFSIDVEIPEEVFEYGNTVPDSLVELFAYVQENPADKVSRIVALKEVLNLVIGEAISKEFWEIDSRRYEEKKKRRRLVRLNKKESG